MNLTEELFLADVAQHTIEIVRDDGVHRHIRLRKPGTMCMHFDLITWPGYLCYTGDMGTYVFRRLEDMFEFFRTDRVHSNSRGDKKLSINPGYWGEKLQATDIADGFKEFSEERFKSAVMGDLFSWIKDHYQQTTKDERRDLWDAVTDRVIGASADSEGYSKQAAANDFRHHIRRDLTFRFRDFWDHNVQDYSYRFMWCCYALAWGIQQYDDWKDAKAGPASSLEADPNSALTPA